MQFRVRSGQVTVNVASRAQLLDAVAGRWQAGAGFALATLNLDHLAKLNRSAAFRAAYTAQDLVTADGNPIVWLARLRGERIDLLPGSDLIVPLAQVAAAQGVAVALVGATQDSLAQAARALQAAVPGIEIVAQIAPPMGFDPESDAARAVLEGVAASGAGLCFLALGAPKQEMLAARGRQIAPAVGFASIGAGLDFLAGHQRRAPRWVRRIAAEWLWRMLSDPRRLAGRYARAALVLPGHALRSITQRRRG